MNQNALIIGGGTGIGLATAKGLVDSGCRCAIAGRRQEKLEEASASHAGEHALATRAVDVAQRESVSQLVAWFNETIGPIDILVNAAGVNIPNRTMAEMQPEQWDEVMEINATGAYNCLHAVLPQMRERAQGTIILINSISGKRALSIGGVAYCASKFAMSSLGTSVAVEEASHGIRITNLYPGEVDTPLLEKRPTPVSQEHRQRILQPSDVADLIVAICQLPSRAHVPEVIIKPRLQEYC